MLQGWHYLAINRIDMRSHMKSLLCQLGNVSHSHRPLIVVDPIHQLPNCAWLLSGKGQL
ncbi:MAG: hypothetical protein AMXMBFR77_17170 [Phycisphaerales bacterium]